MKQVVQKKDQKHQHATFSRVLKLITPYRIFIILSIVSAAVSVFGQLYIPILAGHAIDFMIGEGKVDFFGVKNILLEILIVAGVAGFGQWISGVSNNHITYCVSRNLRDSSIHKIQTLPLSYLDSHQTGDLLSRVVADIDLFSDGLLMGFTQFFSGVLTILGTLIFMLTVNLPIALVVIGVTPLSLVLAFIGAFCDLTLSHRGGRRKPSAPCVLCQ